MLAWALVCAVVAFFVFLANQPLFLEPYGFVASALVVAWGRRVAEPEPLPLRPRRKQSCARLEPCQRRWPEAWNTKGSKPKRPSASASGSPPGSFPRDMQSRGAGRSSRPHDRRWHQVR